MGFSVEGLWFAYYGFPKGALANIQLPAVMWAYQGQRKYMHLGYTVVPLKELFKVYRMLPKPLKKLLETLNPPRGTRIEALQYASATHRLAQGSIIGFQGFSGVSEGVQGSFRETQHPKS